MKETGQHETLYLNRRDAITLSLLLLLSTGLLVAGLFLPMLTITKLLMFSHSFSVVSGVSELWLNGHYILFVVVAGFSIVMPIFKIAILFRVLIQPRHATDSFKRLLHLMHEYGRWSMLDVMVVAVLIMTVKLGAIASIEVHQGLFVFALSVVLIMFVTQRVVKLTRDPLRQ